VLAAVLVAATVTFAAAALGGARRHDLIAGGRPDPGRDDAMDPRGSWVHRALPLAAIGGVALGLMTVGPVPTAVASGAGAAIVIAVRRRRRTKTAVLLEVQLADAVAAVASGVRSGLSSRQAIALAADRAPEPMSSSLQEVIARTTLGSSLDDALERWATVVPVPDVRLAAAVLQLHRGTGGGFPVVLDGLARTLRERRAAQREVRSLTAQARLSGAILGLLPVAFFLFLSVTSRRDMTAALGTSVGRTAVVVGVGLQAAAFLWIRRLLRVEA